MPALNFQERFAADVESGKKRQTIRAHRKRPFKVGDTLYLYTGMRTKACRKLGEVKCTSVEAMRIGGHFVDDFIAIGSRALATRERHHLAVGDGFNGVEELLEWFRKTHGLPFQGQIIRW